MNIVLFIIIVLFEIYLAIMGNKPYKIEEDLLMKKELKILAEEIIKQIPTGERNIERGEGIFTVDELKYTYEEAEVLSIDDEGKYQYGSTIYGIGLLDEVRGYGTKGDILFHIKQDFTRSGSYFSDYYYDYEKPYLVEQVTKVITTTEWEGIE